MSDWNQFADLHKFLASGLIYYKYLKPILIIKIHYDILETFLYIEMGI